MMRMFLPAAPVLAVLLMTSGASAQMVEEQRAALIEGFMAEMPMQVDDVSVLNSARFEGAWLVYSLTIDLPPDTEVDVNLVKTLKLKDMCDVLLTLRYPVAIEGLRYEYDIEGKPDGFEVALADCQ